MPGLDDLGDLVGLTKGPLVIRGHAQWPVLLAEFGNAATQVLNVDHRAVVLRRG